jgi:hypothetical protein
VTDRKLRVVESDVIYDLGRKPETLSERARRLHLEAQVLASEEVDVLCQTLIEAVAKAEAIRDGGEIFPVGVREQARQLAARLPQTTDTLRALTDRHLRQVTGAPVQPVWRSET